MFVSPHALTSRVVWHVTDKGWSSDFPPLPDAFSPKRTMALLSGSHNGVHCCGTVGDSHSHSQLSTAKCTFTGDSFQNHDARTVQTECNRACSNYRGAARSRNFIAKLRKVERKTKKFLLFFCRDGVTSRLLVEKVTKKACKEQRILEN